MLRKGILRRRLCPSCVLLSRCALRLCLVAVAIALAVVLLYGIPASRLSTFSFLTKSPPEARGPSDHVTSAITSTYRLLTPKLRRGDTAHVLVQAKDSEGRARTTGGDFWLPVLTSAPGAYPTVGGRTAGRVTDHHNGTYSVRFHAGWEGVAFVRIVLSHSSHATRWLRDVYWPAGKRVFWLGQFSDQDRTVCYLSRNVTSRGNVCVIEHEPIATGSTAFHCEKPRSVSCQDLETIVLFSELINNRTRELLGDNIALFKGDNGVLTQGPRYINIERRQSPANTRPPCKPDSGRLPNDGFWLNNDWHYLQCNTVGRWDKPQAVRDCLRHRYVIMHGDSNIRSWYRILTKKLYYGWEHLGRNEYKVAMQDYYERHDLEMRFNFHPHLLTALPLPLNATPYEVAMLDGIPADDCGRYIVVLCPWGHFTQWTRTSYAERTRLLREAVLRLRERCPDVPVVIKGPHPREHQTDLMSVFASDYTLWELGAILRDSFRGTGAFYYDVWQMSLGYGKPNIHMPVAVIDEEVNMFLSYICP